MRGRLPTVLRAAPLLVACLALPASAAAAPTISGSDWEWWNAETSPARYVITSDGGQLQWRLAGGDWSPARRSPLTVTLPRLPDGAYLLEAREIGAAGVTTSARAFRIDTVPPTIDINAPADGAEYTQGDVVAADFACEAGASCAGPVAPGAPIATSSPGEHTFAVAATDPAGNTARRAHRYVVRPAAPAAPPPPAPAGPLDVQPPTPAGPGAPPASIVQGPSLAPPAQAVPPPTSAPAQPLAARVVLPRLNARRLLPRAGARLRGTRPVLRWPALRRARVYNVQVFRIQGTRAVKVASLFPRGNRVRVPPRRLRPGAVHVWRVWPMVGRRFTKRPIGVSHFSVLRPARPR